MITDAQVEAAAKAAAEMANGGMWNDPLYYKPEHQKFWKAVIRTALEAAKKVCPTITWIERGFALDNPDVTWIVYIDLSDGRRVYSQACISVEAKIGDVYDDQTGSVRACNVEIP